MKTMTAAPQLGTPEYDEHCLARGSVRVAGGGWAPSPPWREPDEPVAVPARASSTALIVVPREDLEKMRAPR